jgi:hypothetical protein
MTSHAAWRTYEEFAAGISSRCTFAGASPFDDPGLGNAAADRKPLAVAGTVVHELWPHKF